MGSQVYPKAKRLLITADGGGSHGSRCRLWQVELQGLADEIGLCISVCHFPPGTSKWNKIEHRMFGHITENWRGRPLVSREVVVNLIGHTTTKTGVGDSVGTGREQLSNRSRSHGAATGEPRHQAGQVPRRMELYHPAKDINGQFILARRLSPLFVPVPCASKSSHPPPTCLHSLTVSPGSFCDIVAPGRHP